MGIKMVTGNTDMSNSRRNYSANARQSAIMY